MLVQAVVRVYAVSVVNGIGQYSTLHSSGDLSTDFYETWNIQQVASLDTSHPQYVIIRRSGQGSAFWGDKDEIWNLTPFIPKKPKNWDFKLEVKGTL